MTTSARRKRARRHRGAAQRRAPRLLVRRHRPADGGKHYLREVVPAGPQAEAEADKSLRRLLSQIDERRNPTTNGSLDQLLDRYLETLDVGEGTRTMYPKYLEKHVRPFLGRTKAAVVDAEVRDSLYAELRRCGRGGPDNSQ